MTGGATATGTWAELYRHAAGRVGDREARWMVEEACGSRLAHAAGPAPGRARARLEAMVERRLAGEPLQYVLGSWAFRRLELMVDRRVLIPRPETEQVVEVALAELDRVAACRPSTEVNVVDLGTGSGAIALSVVTERAGVRVWATDASPDALAVAGANLAGLAGHAATRVRLAEGPWWAALPAELRGRVDLAVSNPPYISTAEMAGLDPEVVEWEPRAALEAGPIGIEAIEEIVVGADEWLSAAGTLVVEIAPHQAEDGAHLAVAHGFVGAEVLSDLAGRQRVLVARKARTQ